MPRDAVVLGAAVPCGAATWRGGALVQHKVSLSSVADTSPGASSKGTHKAARRRLIRTLSEPISSGMFIARGGRGGAGWSVVSRLLRSLVLLIALISSPTNAQAEEDNVSGSWSASPLQVAWALGNWESTCGPKPSPQGDAGGTVQLSASRAEFSLHGLGRSYTTTSCWEQLPGLQVRSHSASATTVRSSCEMPKGDPRQAKVVTTWALRGDKIYFDETGQYQFLSKDGSCTASVRRTRLLSRIEKSASDGAVPSGANTKPSQEKASATLARVDEAASSPACAGEQKASRVDLTIVTPLLRAGDSLVVDSRAYATNGCRAASPARLEFLSGKELVEETSPGNFRVRLEAPSGKLRIAAVVDDVRGEGEVTVVSRNELESFFAGALPVITSAPPTTERPSAQSEGMAGRLEEPDRKLWIGAAALGLLASALGIGLLWRKSVRRRGGDGSLPLEQVVIEEVNPLAETAGVFPPHVIPPARMCPTCGERYTGTETFCGKDGTRLFREN